MTQPRVFACFLLLLTELLASCGEKSSTRPSGNAAGSTSVGGQDNSGGSGNHSTLPAFASVFDENALPRFDITLSKTCLSSLESTPEQYCPGELRYRDHKNDDLSFKQVGVRLKGSASYQPLSEKPSFKLKMDEFIDQKLNGLRRITLNAMNQDPSMLREVLGYRFYRQAIGVAPYCNHAEIYLNGDFYGLYANVQTLDDEFVQSQFTTEVGNLYDVTNHTFGDVVPSDINDFELETNRSANDTSDLVTLVEAADQPVSTFYHDVGQFLDWKEVLANGAAQAIIADWDGYFGGTNNYKLYHERSRDKFIMLPWGIDETFGVTADVPNDPLAQLNYSIEGTNSRRKLGILFIKCRRDLDCWTAYLDSVDSALAVFEGLDLDTLATSLRELTLDATIRDTRKSYSDEVVATHVIAVKSFIEQRQALVRAELERLRNSLINGPDGAAFCAIEGERCEFKGKGTVAYGANGVFTYLEATDGISCDNATFGGDPTPNVFKSCYLKQN